MKWNTASPNGRHWSISFVKQIPNNLPQVESSAEREEKGFLRHLDMLKLSKAKITFMLCD